MTNHEHRKKHVRAAQIERNPRPTWAEYTGGNDFPGLSVNTKVTSIRQPQSSSLFRSASQKIYGLGYSLLIFVYQKTATLGILHTVLVDVSRTVKYQITRGILEIIERNGNTDDLAAFMMDRNPPVDDVGRMH